jgi:serine/threonine protein phosphatase PrpC
MERDAMPLIAAHGLTDVGLKRKNNEDAFYINQERGFCLVADGMGGAAAGELASQIFVETAVAIWQTAGELSEQDRVERVQYTFAETNKRILAHVRDNPLHEGMGCTGELITFFGTGFVIGHIGDSRTYRHRDGNLRQLTHDHSMVQDQLDQGLITEEQAKNHPYRSVIHRAIGIDEQLKLDISRGQTATGDIFLLCSDGLTDMVDNRLIEEILSASDPISQKTENLIEAAKRAGGKDNITAVLTQTL